jgi:hypothetical protein
MVSSRHAQRNVFFLGFNLTLRITHFKETQIQFNPISHENIYHTQYDAIPRTEKGSGDAKSLCVTIGKKIKVTVVLSLRFSSSRYWARGIPDLR